MRELYKVQSAALSDDIIKRISALALEQPSEDARIFTSDETMQHLRSCTVRWIKDAWLQDLLWTYVEAANRQCFQVELQNRAEMQVVEYSAAESNYYDWHQDVQWYGQSDFDRKLSVTIQLSDELSYQGGDFEFEDVQTNADFRSKGTVLIFPSYLRHKIHPVSQGTRRALVAWFYGTRWR